LGVDKELIQSVMDNSGFHSKSYLMYWLAHYACVNQD